MAEEDGKLDLVAAYRAYDFFDSPSEKTFTQLRRSAEKISAWSPVRDGALVFLQIGRHPGPGGKGTPPGPCPNRKSNIQTAKQSSG
jgi:hypothetical protein